MADKSNDTMKVGSHLLGLFLGILGPAIVLLSTKDDDVKEHAKRALNWQISYMIYFMISLMLAMVLIGFLFVFILVLLDLGFCVNAAIKANKGELWDYPLAIKIMK